MILGSHNSWSYLPVESWWMHLLKFTAKCQSVDIKTQYEKYGIRCFDLRLQFNYGIPVIAHGIIKYKYTFRQLSSDLNFLNSKGDCTVRVMLETRDEKDYITANISKFKYYCRLFEYH